MIQHPENILQIIDFNQNLQFAKTKDRKNELNDKRHD